ncbi:hypothetical protein IU448_15100 [Nocardia flavorosea]|uniref:hypothetical protein n=1 Tax=Nocardia flavorosea TaxID=53429 RepID=UPI001894F3AF|nr:hypothetical protein [Nocardia flavorosea]MBF6350333.1 hypothetical protein [Nocardia flavorosea]
MTAYNSLDALKYLARRMRSTVDWTTDSMWASLSAESGLSLDIELDALGQLVTDMDSLLGSVALDWDRYSDGRPVTTRVDIEFGHRYEHLWHPDPAQNKAEVLNGRRLADPGEDRGSWEIHISPPSTLHVVLLPPKPALRAVPAE